jgi:hypothetical protein
MNIPLSINDIIIFISVTSLILLITSEILNPRYGQTKFVIEKKRISSVAIVSSIFFFLMILIKIYEIINS